MSLRVSLLSVLERPRFFALSEEAGTLFVQEHWCHVYGDALRIAGLWQGDDLIGGFVFTETRMKGIRAWITPPFAPHCGLFFRETESENQSKINSFRKRVLREIAGFLEDSGPAFVKLEWPHTVTDVQPLLWQGMEISPKYTYVIGLSVPEETLRKNADPKVRGLLDPGELLLDTQASPAELMAIVHRTFQKKSLRTNERTAAALVEQAYAGRRLIATVVRRGDEIQGAFVCVHDSHTCYYLFGHTVDACEKNTGHTGLWHCIQQARARGLQCFDFEGSMIPGVEHFFRSFGGRQVPYFQLTAGNRWIRLLWQLFRK